MKHYSIRLERAKHSLIRHLETEISDIRAENERNEADVIELNNELRNKKELIKRFRKDIDAVAELKNLVLCCHIVRDILSRRAVRCYI